MDQSGTTDRRRTTEARREYVACNGRDFVNYWQQVDECYVDRMNAFGYYTELVDALRVTSRIEVRPLRQLLDPTSDRKHVVGLRHDIDADPLTALRCARYLARVGLPGSFYLLHSAPYYGDFHDGVFVRNPEVPRWLRAMLVAGCEIGIHNDVMGIETQFGVDGPTSLVTELAWLRAHGADVRGTVAHNSFSLYGAENYEVFRDRVLLPTDVAFDERRAALPIGRLDEAELNLRYEGTFASPRSNPDLDAVRAFVEAPGASVRSDTWMRTYLLDNPYCEWKVDSQLWLTGRDEWVLASRIDQRATLEFGIDLGRAIDRLRALPEGSRTLIVVHPVYVRGS
ncbi:MAG: hypothetical protein KDB80_10595 [Planctomycetes bacterium]|nr:hypothetical protein [Planctomycetota bacterium]